MTAIDDPAVRFDHVGVSVPDLEAAAAWYCETFRLSAAPSFTVKNSDLRGVMLHHERSGYRIELLHRPGAAPGLQPTDPYDAAGTLGYGHFCLAVTDVETTFAQLIAAGASQRMAPSPAPRPGATVAFVADPWSNLIEIISLR